MIEQENEKMKEELNQLELVCKNQVQYNKWLLKEILKLKEGLDQIGKNLDLILKE